MSVTPPQQVSAREQMVSALSSSGIRSARSKVDPVLDWKGQLSGPRNEFGCQGRFALLYRVVSMVEAFTIARKGPRHNRAGKGGTTAANLP
jgi:hypothetical protein